MATKPGLSEAVVRDISTRKGEPAWMTAFRLNALAIFEQKPMPTWGADLSELAFHDIHYYVKPHSEQRHSWDEVPSDIKNTFTALGIPQA
jgi:Fe-S cluster assembly protein SufB